jgi:hypothetical protein
MAKTWILLVRLQPSFRLIRRRLLVAVAVEVLQQVRAVQRRIRRRLIGALFSEDGEIGGGSIARAGILLNATQFILPDMLCRHTVGHV